MEKYLQFLGRLIQALDKTIPNSLTDQTAFDIVVHAEGRIMKLAQR
jgi:hypothetical protein